MIVAAAVILNKVVWLRTHVCIGGQNNSDSTWLEAVEARSVVLGIIYLLVHHLARQEWIRYK